MDYNMLLKEEERKNDRKGIGFRTGIAENYMAQGRQGPACPDNGRVGGKEAAASDTRLSLPKRTAGI